MANDMEINNKGCKRFLLSGAAMVLMVAVAFMVGANGLGMLLVGAAIATFGYGAGTVMNSEEPMHKDFQ